MRHVILSIGVFLVGGTLTVGGIKYDIPGLEQLKWFVVDEKDIIKRYRSYHPVTVVLAVRKNGDLWRTEIKSVSDKANEFYGFTPAGDHLIGRDFSFLLAKLERWMEPTDFLEFKKDQDEVIEDYIEGRDAYARIPIRFNEHHPIPRYNNRSYLPVIVGLSDVEEKNGTNEQLMTILYLDTKTISGTAHVPMLSQRSVPPSLALQ